MHRAASAWIGAVWDLTSKEPRQRNVYLVSRQAGWFSWYTSELQEQDFAEGTSRQGKCHLPHSLRCPATLGCCVSMIVSGAKSSLSCALQPWRMLFCRKSSINLSLALLPKRTFGHLLCVVITVLLLYKACVRKRYIRKQRIPSCCTCFAAADLSNTLRLKLSASKEPRGLSQLRRFCQAKLKRSTSLNKNVKKSR